MRRSCPACGADDARAIASIDAQRVVRGNATYRPEATDILGIAPDARYDFVRCARCAFVYARDLPDAEFLRNVYERVIDPVAAGAISRSPSWIAHQLQLAASLLSRVAGTERVRLLDYGCGDGTVVHALNAAGISCLGFDPYQRQAAAHITDSRDAVRAAAPFDGVLLSDVLEHVPEPRQVLDECRELLSTGGWICVSVPDFGARRLRGVLADLEAGRDVTPELNPWEHLNYFSPRSLAAMLDGAGFAVDPQPSPEFGFRNERRPLRKITNTIRSAARLLRFAASPAPGSTTIFARKL